MRAIVCGGRDYANRAAVFTALDDLWVRHGLRKVAHGDYKGADALARQWCKWVAEHVTEHPYPANWIDYGKAAGPRRNRLMLTQFKPHVVVAFPGHDGTADMIGIAKKCRVRVWQPVKELCPFCHPPPAHEQMDLIK